MAWQIREQYVDKRLGTHIAILHEPSTSAEHQIHIHIGHDSCHHCGTVKPKTNSDEIDGPAFVKEVLEQLQASHSQVEAYAAKHRLLVVKSPR